MKKLLLAVIFATALAPPAGQAQVMCKSAVGVCQLARGVTGAPCACFTPSGPVQGVVAPGISAAKSMQLAHFCCTKFGRIGPMKNYGVPAGQTCSVVTQNGTPAGGKACN